MQNKYVPLWEQDGNVLFVNHLDFVSDTEDGAREIQLGSMFVEGIMLNILPMFNVLCIEENKVPHVLGNIGGYSVCVVSGPIFDAAKKEEQDDKADRNDL